MENLINTVIYVLIIFSAVFIIPLFYSMKMFGKKKTYFISMCIFIIPFFFIINYNPVGLPGKFLLLALAASSGLAFQTEILVSISMLSKIIKQDKVKREGIYLSFFFLIKKLGKGFVQCFCGMILQKYMRNTNVQNIEIERTIKYLISLLPIVMIMLSLICLIFYQNITIQGLLKFY